MPIVQTKKYYRHVLIFFEGLKIQKIEKISTFLKG